MPATGPGVAAGPTLLFAGSGVPITPSDQEAIFAALGLVHDPANSERLLDRDCGLPVDVMIGSDDLDGDGDPEVFAELGSLCLYGGTGIGTTLFVRDPAGTYRPHLGFPGMVVEQLAERREGFPDLMIGGMSDCFAVWGWNGSTYEHLRNEPQSAGACAGLAP